MQTRANNPRLSHVGKSRQELAAYHKFLREDLLVEKTEESKQLMENTYVSTFEEADQPLIPTHARHIPVALKFWRAMKSNWVVTIGGTLLAGLIWGYVMLIGDVQTQRNRIQDISRIVDDLDRRYDVVASLDKNLNVFKVGIEKDIELIKYRLSEISR